VDAAKYTDEWYDIVPIEKMPFVCEYTLDLGQECKVGWTTSSDNSKCFKFNNWEKDFDDAKWECHEDGAILAMPKTAALNGDIYDLCAHRSPCWIGLSRNEGDENSWQWMDGSALSWQYWKEGEPNNADLERGEETAAVIGFYRWSEAMAGGLFVGAITGFACVLINIGVACGVCCLVYFGLKSKNDGMIIASAGCDAYCGFCVCLSIAGAIPRILGEGAHALNVGPMVLNLIQMIFICALAGCGFTMRNKMLEEKHAANVHGGAFQPMPGQQVVGMPAQPVMGTVVGQPQPVMGAVVVNSNIKS